MTARKETGIEELRRVVNAAGYSNEDALYGFSAEASGWDIFPDQLTAEERAHAAQAGTLSHACLARLQRTYG